MGTLRKYDAGVARLRNVRRLDLQGTRVTDAGLRNARSIDVSGLTARCAIDELRRLELVQPACPTGALTLAY